MLFIKFQANEFLDTTGIDALAVCIGNVHGKYPSSGPNLRLDLLKASGFFASFFAVHVEQTVQEMFELCNNNY